MSVFVRKTSRNRQLRLSVKEKSEILTELSQGVCLKVISKKYGINKSTVCRIKKNESNIKKFLAQTESGPGKRKNLKTSEFPKMEKALYDWFMKKRADNVPVSSEVLVKKAKMLHNSIKEHSGEFRGSSGWITNFKKRHGIRVLKITGEKLSNVPESVPPFLLKFENKVREKDLKPEQIYNADESGLFWKLLPAKTMVHFKERSAPGRKTSKQRITFLACTNATGSHKLKPLVIGKAKKPRAFKNFGNIPVVYKANRNAWMTLVMFEEWMQNNFVPEVTLLSVIIQNFIN